MRSGVDPGAVSDSFKTIFRYGAAKHDLANQLNANTVIADDRLVRQHLRADGRRSGLGAQRRRQSPRAARSWAADRSRRWPTSCCSRASTPASCARTRWPISSARTLPTTSATSSSTSPRCSTRKCMSSRRRRSRSMKDLDGKTVAVDLPDGSTFVTSINVFERLGIKPHLLYIEPRIALEHAAPGRDRRDHCRGRKAAAMARPGQRPQPASGSGRV